MNPTEYVIREGTNRTHWANIMIEVKFSPGTDEIFVREKDSNGPWKVLRRVDDEELYDRLMDQRKDMKPYKGKEFEARNAWFVESSRDSTQEERTTEETSDTQERTAKSPRTERSPPTHTRVFHKSPSRRRIYNA